jgi:hypothetical protein
MSEPKFKIGEKVVIVGAFNRHLAGRLGIVSNYYRTFDRPFSEFTMDYHVYVEGFGLLYANVREPFEIDLALEGL